MKTDNNYVRSGHTRIKDDNYHTIDPRCTLALLETIPVYLKNKDIVDVCSPSGSGIVDTFKFAGVDARCWKDAFADGLRCDWAIFNPPYARGLVDDIIYEQLSKLEDGDIQEGIAVLLRTQFDHAKSRVKMFKDEPKYLGQLKMLFRPKWIPDTKIEPIHSYVWHIWTRNNNGNTPHVWYWSEK